MVDLVTSKVATFDTQRARLRAQEKSIVLRSSDHETGHSNRASIHWFLILPDMVFRQAREHAL